MGPSSKKTGDSLFVIFVAGDYRFVSIFLTKCIEWLDRQIWISAFSGRRPQQVGKSLQTRRHQLAAWVIQVGKHIFIRRTGEGRCPAPWFSWIPACAGMTNRE